MQNYLYTPIINALNSSKINNLKFDNFIPTHNKKI